MSMSPKQYFDTFFPEKLKAEPELASSINAVFVFDVTGDGGGTWTVDLTVSGGKVAQGAADHPGCTIIMAGEDFVAMMEKEANPMQLYMAQKLKITGNMALALKLQDLIK